MINALLSHFAETANCGDTQHIGSCTTNLPAITAGSGEVQTVLNILFGIIGALSILMIVIAGLRFITGQGNPQEISKARSTIIYALVGLIISLAAVSIVNLAVNKL
ncbi:MAG TPA: pilin [Candidatus Saccharimonadales bacterium]|nr:pilin [Candidatus Saccharimonadales bacterium]